MHLRIEREAMFESGLYPFTVSFTTTTGSFRNASAFEKSSCEADPFRIVWSENVEAAANAMSALAASEWRPQSRSQDCSLPLRTCFVLNSAATVILSCAPRTK